MFVDDDDDAEMLAHCVLLHIFYLWYTHACTRGHASTHHIRMEFELFDTTAPYTYPLKAGELACVRQQQPKKSIARTHGTDAPAIL